MSQPCRDLFQSDEARKIREFNDRLTASLHAGNDHIYEVCQCCGVEYQDGQPQCPHKPGTCE